QPVRERRTDHGPATESHDGKPRRHTATVRKPLDQGRHGRNVTQPQADAADDARPQPHEPDLVNHDTEGGDDESTAPTEGRDHTGLARPYPLEPPAHDGGRGPEEYEKDRVGPPQHGDFP